MTALWQRYENRQVQPTAPAPEVQARLSALEKEVATLKALLQFGDEELASRDFIISDERSATSRLKKEVFEANERYTRSVASLSAELDCTDQLASRLQAVQNECSEACKNAENAEAEKEKLKSEVERLEAERDKAVKAQDRSESLLIRLRARYDAGQAKLNRYLKQLSYVPFLRDQSWARGFNWGFELMSAKKCIFGPP
jgi:chromosome segregation ATPase